MGRLQGLSDMKIAVLGAGGMGSRFGLYLHRAGNEVVMIDGWKANVDAIRANGLKADLNGTEIVDRIPVFTPEEADKADMNADLIIVLVKAPQLEGILEAVKPLIKEDTHVICLMNGIGHEDVLKKYVKPENILLGVTMWTAGMKGPGSVELLGDGYVEIQELYPEGKEEALKIIDAFDKAGLRPKYSENLHYSIYRKACINGVINTLCALMDCNMMELAAMPYTADISRKIVSEFAACAAKEGVTLDQEEVNKAILVSCEPEHIGKHYPSMYQDLINNHRKTEIDYINGAISRKGKRYDVPTPYCDLITELIHNKEQFIGAK